MITHKPEFILSLKIHIMVNNEAIDAAVAFLESSEKPNFKKTAKKFMVDRNTLRRRYKGKSISYKEAITRCSMKLSPEQEEVLVCYIIDLINWGIPPSPCIVKNFAEEIIADYLNKQ